MGFRRTDTDSRFSKLVVTSCLLLIPVLSTFQAMGLEGVIPRIQQHYNIKDAETASIITVSSIAHTITIALIWLFGDTFKRRWLFLISVSCWIVFTLISIIVGSKSFMIFVIFRALGGAASSIFGILVPVILADMLHDRELGVALALQSVTEIAASMLTGIVSSWIVTSTVPWQAGMLLSTCLSIIPLFVLFCFKSTIRNVKRADSHGVGRIFSSAFSMFKVKSYLLMTAESSIGSLHSAAYSFWYPSVYLLAWTNVPEVFLGMSYTTITAIDSALMLAGTGVGLPIILGFAQSWRYGTGPFSGRQECPRAYPIITGIFGTLNIGFFIMKMVLMDKSYPLAMVNTFLFGISKANGLAVGQQIMFAVIPSSNRAATVALGRLIAGSVSIPAAQIVGFISDSIRGDSMAPLDRFHAYQLILLSTSIFMALGVLCHIAMIVVFPGDCERAEQKELEEEEQESVDEKSFLTGKGRSESIMETYVRSRATTVNSFL